uniref:Uncharacterized protein n=1 Tax=Caenorhabditis japonica TaxID=281687 RepID=A0A8R1ILB7_CAEJA
MVRLVFRPYTQVYRSICTSEPIRTSTRVSSGFILLRHSSPSFGSLAYCSTSTQSQVTRIGPWCDRTPKSTDPTSVSSRLTFTFIAPQATRLQGAVEPTAPLSRTGLAPSLVYGLNRKDFGHTTLLEDYTYTPHFQAAKD